MSDEKPETTPESGLDALSKLSGADFNLQLRAYGNILREVFEGASCSASRRLVTIANADMWAFRFVVELDPNVVIVDDVRINDTSKGYTSFFVLTDKEAGVRNTLRARKVKSF